MGRMGKPLLLAPTATPAPLPAWPSLAAASVGDRAGVSQTRGLRTMAAGPCACSDDSVHLRRVLRVKRKARFPPALSSRRGALSSTLVFMQLFF